LKENRKIARGSIHKKIAHSQKKRREIRASWQSHFHKSGGPDGGVNKSGKMLLMKTHSRFMNFGAGKTFVLVIFTSQILSLMVFFFLCLAALLSACDCVCVSVRR